MSGPPPTTVYRFEVLCLDRADGRILWRKTAVEEVPHEGVHSTAGYASPSPATDGRTLIASFGSRGVFAYDLDGALLWKKDLGDLRIKNSFGEGISPALHAGQFFGGDRTARSALDGGNPSVRLIGRACQNCHSQVHGSNHPSGARFQR